MNKKNLFFFIIIIIFMYSSQVSAAEISCRYEMNDNNLNEKFVLIEEYEGSKKLKLISDDKYMKISENEIYLNDDNSCPSVSLYYGTGMGKRVYPSQKICQASEPLLPNYCSPNLIGVKKEENDVTDDNYVGKFQAALVKKTSDICEYKSEKDGPSYYISTHEPFGNELVYAEKVGNFYYYMLEGRKGVRFLTTQGKYFSVKDNQISCPTYIYLEKKWIDNFWPSWSGILSSIIDPLDPRNGSYWAYVIVGKSNENDSNQTDIENPITGDNNEVQEEPTPKPSGDVDCNGIFANEFGEYLKQIYDLLKFAVPILILGYAIVDFLKALAAQDDAEVKKAANKLVKRLMIGVLIFVLPTILEFFLNLAGVQFGVCDLGT